MATCLGDSHHQARATGLECLVFGIGYLVGYLASLGLASAIFELLSGVSVFNGLWFLLLLIFPTFVLPSLALYVPFVLVTYSQSRKWFPLLERGLRHLVAMVLSSVLTGIILGAFFGKLLT